MKRFSFLLCIVFCMTFISCQSSSQKYMKEYRTFAEEFILGNNNYTTMEWEAAATEYAALRDQYSLYRMELSQEDRDYIEEVNAKINAAFIRYESTNAVSEFESLIKEAVGTIDELLGE